MGRYLDKFLSTIPKIQTKHIFELLNELRDNGTIKTMEEYNTKLKELTETLKSKDPVPTFTLFQALVGKDVSSDLYNTMVKAVVADLDTAFQEAENISDVLDLHKNLYKLTVIKALKKAVKELERRITLYEFFANSYDGYTSAQFNTFDESERHDTPRSDALADVLYYDFSRRANILAEDDAAIDVFKEGLILPSIVSQEVKVVDIDTIDDGDASVSTRDVSDPSLSIRNAIDGKLHTYWVHPILLNAVESDGVTIKVKLDLGGAREINTIYFEQIGQFPVELEKVEYLSQSSQSEELTVTGVIDGDTSVHFTSVVARYLILTLRQDCWEEALYHRRLGVNVWERVIKADLDPETPDNEAVSRLADELGNVISDQEVRDMCDIATDVDWEQVKGYQYTFGFDNIKVYLNKYRTQGVYVGEKLEVDRPGVIALKTTEDKPDVSVGGLSYQPFSFEYYVFKRNFDSGNSLLDEELVPILPVGYGDIITGERLHLVETNDASTYNTAYMRFIPDTSTTPEVKQDIITDLDIGTDYEVKVRGDSTWYTTWAGVETALGASPYADGAGLNIKIKFLNPKVQAFYTINYTADTSATTTDYRKVSDWIKMQRNGVLRCDIGRVSATVAKSHLYLIAIMRRNYTANDQTPTLEDYKLLVSSYKE
jgi:hypothetical protein